MRLREWTGALEGAADEVETFMAALEAVLVSVLGRAATWLAPLLPAIMVARAMTRVFGLTGAWPGVVAGVVEMVGMTTGAWWTTAREWNATKNKSDPAANERLALGLLGAYFLTTVLLLLAVEVPELLDTGDFTGLTALLFPGLAGVSLIALNERVAHGRRVREKMQKKRSGGRSGGRSGRGSGTGQGSGQGRDEADGADRTESVSEGSLTHANRSRQEQRERALTALLEFYAVNPGGSYSQAGAAAGRSKSWAVGAVRELEEAGRLRRNGSGFEVLGGAR